MTMNDDKTLDTDILILGGGSAGCVLAARLSEDPRRRVTLVEAGGDGRSALVRTPAALVAMLPTRLNNWALQTVPQPGLNGRRGYQPRGRTLGGSSAINAMVYMRGHPGDYDDWAAAGNPGWAWRDVLPWFRRAEHNESFDDEWHGRGGPLNVAALRTDNPFHLHLAQAARQAGYPVNADFNGAEQEGIGSYQVTQKDGERCSAFRAYLQPVLQRPNLQVLTHTSARRLLWSGGRVSGAEVQGPGGLRLIRARGDTVVSAGAFHSPQLLMVSGIGCPQQLQPHGINVRHALPGVGRNLQDHVDFIFGYHAPTVDLLGVSPGGTLRLLREVQRWRQQRRGMLSSNFAEAGGFLRKHASSPRPDFQLHFVVAIVEDHARRLHLRHGLSCHVSLLRPRSRGQVSLAGPAMDQPPQIDPCFFSDPADLDDMVQGFKLTRRLLQQPALAHHVRRDLFTAHVHSDDDIRQVLRDRSDTIYHPAGTCRMGPAADPQAVVDAQLRVHGVGGLRVVDASIMPTLVGGNPNAPTIMVAEKAAHLMAKAA